MSALAPWILLSCLLIGGVPAVAQTIRTAVEPAGGLVLGQPVHILVDVLFPDGMPRPPRVALPEPSGTQILRNESQATTIRDTINGRDQAGQRFEFTLYPRRGGTIEIPAAEVTVLDRAGAETGRATGTPTTIEVSVPAGVDPSNPVVATKSLALDQRWSPDPRTSLKVGGALIRTITREAAGVPAMAMLDLNFSAPPGVRVYVDAPLHDDRVARGDLTGERTDRATYVFERGGSFALDAVDQTWWDLGAGQPRRAEGRGVVVTVMAVAQPHGTRTERWAFLTAMTACLLALLWWVGQRLWVEYCKRRARWQASERKAFRDLEKTCRHGDDHAIYRAFTLWRPRVARPSDLSSFAEEIEAVLFTAASWPSGGARDFGVRLRKWRRPAGSARGGSALPPLNPVYQSAHIP